MKIRAILLCALVLPLAACATTKKDLSVGGGPVAVGHTAAQVEAAVEAGLKDKGWVETNKQPGRITATVTGIGKGHPSATVAVVYSATAYSIEYVDSANLKYDDKSGDIGRAYGRWTNNLKAAIDAHLQ